MILRGQRPNLKNLSRGSNRVGSIQNCIQYFKIFCRHLIETGFWLKFIKFGHRYGISISIFDFFRLVKENKHTQYKWFIYSSTV